MPRRGFTLLEMIVATLIMGIAVTGLLSGLAGATRNAAHLRDHDRVLQLAELRMNELLTDPLLGRYASLGGGFDPSISGGLQAGWEAQITPYLSPPVPGPGQMALDRVALQIWWISGGDRRTLNLEGFRDRVLTAADMAGAAGP